MPQIQVLPSADTFGSQLAQTLGQVGQDVGKGLIQRSTNTKINSLLKQLQDPGTSQMQKTSIATQVAQLMTPEQSKAVLPLYAPYIYGQGGGVQQPNGASQPAAQSQGMMNQGQAQQGTNQQPNSQMSEKESLQWMVDNPYFGGAAKEKLEDIRIQEKLQGQERKEINKENREEIRKFAEPYGDIEKLKVNVNRLKEAKKLIEGGGISFDENKFRNALVAYLEGNENPMSELLQTPDQQKLWYLLRDSLKPKEIGGSNPSTKEVLIAKASLPNPYKGQLANEYIIDQMINSAQIDLKKGEKISELRRKNPKLDAAEFKGIVDQDIGAFAEENQKKLAETIGKRERVHKAKEQVGMRSPPPGSVWMVGLDGQVGSVLKDRIAEAKENGYESI